MAIGADFSISTNGDIRYTGSGTNYTVLAFHRWIQDLLDDAQASGDDIADITVSTISDRSTDQIVTLNSPYNIDDTAARHLYDGSITQSNGDTVYSGVQVLGSVETGTEIIIIQDGKILPAWWGTGVNADAANAVIMSLMIKTREGGADIDGKRIITFAREFGDTYAEFSATLGLGVAVSAISSLPDLNNGTAAATVRGWSTIANVEGYQLIDIDNNGADEEYYAQFDKGSQTINNTFEWAKLQSARSLVTDSYTDTGDTNLVVDNATTIGQGQEFTSRSVAETLTEMRFSLKIGAGTPTGNMYAELYDSDDQATAEPLPAVQAAVAHDEGTGDTDETTAANEATANDMTLLPATPAVNDAYYWGGDHPFPYFDLVIGTQGSGTWTIVWEYFDGTNWLLLPNITDGTSGFTAAAGTVRVSWDIPSNWVQTTVNAQGPFYYVRARVSAYTSVTTQPLGTQTFKPLAVSEPVLTSLLTASYQDVIFRFTHNADLNASQEYFAVIRHPDGDASNYVHAEAIAAGSDDGNSAAETTIGTWTGVAADLFYTVKSCPIWHEEETNPVAYPNRSGEQFRGITHEIIYDNEAGGPFTENEVVFWGTQITYDTLTGNFQPGEFVEIRADGGAAGTAKNGGKVLKDNQSNTLWLALEDTTSDNLLDNDDIYGINSGASCKIAGALPDANNDDTKPGGEGILLALDDNGAAGDLYIQLISGRAPTDNQEIEGRTSGATCDVNVTVTGRTISQPFIGSSTGTNIIGAYGIGFQTTDVSANDLLTALDGTARNPPNNVTFTVTGLSSGQDRVLVGPRSGTALQVGQFTTDTTLSTNQETAVSIATVAIPTDTPSSGAGTADNTRLRIELDSGIYNRQSYASYDSATPGNFTLNTPANSAVQIDVNAAAVATWTRSSGSWFADGFDIGATFEGSGFSNGGNNTPNEFTVTGITATVLTTAVGTAVTETGSGDEILTVQGWDYSSDNATSGNNVFIAYIDVLADGGTETYTAVYSSDRDLFVRIRDGGDTPIKTFESVSAQFLNTNQSIAAIRNTDL